MLPGWEDHRRWTAGAYFPVFDEERAKTVLAKLNADGLRPFVYLSGLNFTYRNEGRDGGDVTGWERYRITSYNVCYTKLLRPAERNPMLMTRPEPPG